MSTRTGFTRTSLWKRFLLCFSLCLVISGLTFILGCSGTPGRITANPGQEVSLASGQTVAINNEPLEIKFLEVINDSRCPTGVQCVWQGEVSCLLEVTYEGSTYTKVLTEPGLSANPTTTSFDGYDFVFRVTPYPEASRQISKSDYRLNLTVNKPSLSGGILVTFDVVGQTYRIFITNQETIQEVYAVQGGQSQATIPNGRLVRGQVFYNQPWSWHIDSEDIHMAEMTIEVSDGTPSEVENNLDYWINTVKRFSPWSAEIVAIEDYR